MSRLENIVLRVRDTLADPDEERYDVPLIYRLITEAQQAISKLLRNNIKKISVPIVPNQASYALPDDFLELSKVKYISDDDEAKNLTFVSYLQVEDEFPYNWEQSTGTPTHIIFGELGVNQITVYPLGGVGGVLKVVYAALTPQVTALGGLVLPADFDLAIKFYVTGMLLRENVDTQNRSLGNEEMQYFSAEINTLQRRLGKDAVILGSSRTKTYNRAF